MSCSRTVSSSGDMLASQAMMLAHVGAQYKRTGRWEAHIWDSSEPGAKKGRQLHLGSFPAAEPAAMYAPLSHISPTGNNVRAQFWRIHKP